MSDVASTVKEIIVEKLGVKESEVTPEANFTNDLGADSLDTVEMIMEFETKFDIKIADDQAVFFSFVGVRLISDGRMASCASWIFAPDFLAVVCVAR